MDNLDLDSRNIHLGNSYSEFIQLDDTQIEKHQSSKGKAVHCIDTIDQLNERISNLSYDLDGFCGENSPNFNDQNDCLKDVSCIKSASFGNEKDRKEIQQFSGVFAVQTSLIKRNESSLVNKKEDQLHKKVDTSNIGKKPMLVELHSFPGYDEDDVTPLPSSFSADFIMNVVVDAQECFRNKPTFKLKFLQFFTCRESKNVFQDSFWWFFCHKYQPALASQDKMFDRIARNYTSLLFAKSQEKDHDKFFKDYGSLIGQSIYATFCHAFPTSYRQFNGEFRDEILNIIVLWTMGTRPRPRTWESWNFEALEPWGLRKGERIQEDAAKAKNLDLELKQMDEKSRLNTRRNTRRMSRLVFPTRTSTAQANPECNSGVCLSKITSKTGKGTKKKSKTNNDTTLKQISSVLGMVESSYKNQSCEVGIGPSFDKVVFNMYGQSPLVSYYLSSNNLLKNVGTSVLVNRTEISKLPPVDSKTYDDVIDEARKRGEKDRKQFEHLLMHNVNERRKFSHKRGMDIMNFNTRAAKLLSNQKEVKKISDLLRIPENKEEPEESKVRLAKLRSLMVHLLDEEEENK